MEEIELVKVALNLGAFGVVAWLVVQTHRVTIPNLLSDFKASLKDQQATFEGTLDKLRSDCASEREVYKELLQTPMERRSSDR